MIYEEKQKNLKSLFLSCRTKVMTSNLAIHLKRDALKILSWQHIREVINLRSVSKLEL